MTSLELIELYLRRQFMEIGNLNALIRHCAQPLEVLLNRLSYVSAYSYRVKSGIFGQTAKFRQRPCLFHILNIGIKIN